MDQQVVWDRRFGDSRSWLDLGKPDWPRSGWSLARGSTRSGSGRRGLDQADKGHSVGGVEGSGKGKRSRLVFPSRSGIRLGVAVGEQGLSR